MNDDSRSEARHLWYHNTAVQFEIVKALKGYELMIIGEGKRVRWLNVQHVAMLRKQIEGLHLLGKPSSWYRSLDRYASIPLMSWNLHERQEQSEAWNKGPRADAVRGADFGLDLDKKEGSWRDAIRDAEIVCDLFDRYGVRYAFWMSGAHGFHFVVPFEDMPSAVKTLTYDELLSFYKRVALTIAERVPSVDLTIYTPTRVLKAPYTVEKHGLVILPLDRMSFETLKRHGEEWLRPEFVLKNCLIRDRGVFRQGSPDGIKRLIDEWEGWT